MKIKIRDFQSLGKVDIEATGLTVLVGPSNWGKSALVRAVQGALFNRPGEDFIRKGSTQTQVLLEDLPSATGTPLTLLWQKGHNLNRFTVNGQVFDKVGQETPPTLQSSGYRDIFIGDKERQKGKEIRPQIGGQFDPPFLLTEQGSFVNDVLSVVSRLGVLLNANGRCAKDLKASRGTLTVRQKDLKAGEAKLAVLQPIVDQHTRVLALQATLDKAKQIDALLMKVRTLATTRTALKTFIDATVIPAATTVPDDLGVTRLLQGMTLARRRSAVLHVRDLTLPEATADAEAAVNIVASGCAKVGRGRSLTAHRPALVRAAAMTLGVEGVVLTHLAKCDEWVKTSETLRGALATRETATHAVYTAISSLNGIQTQEVEADTALAAALEGMTICPVCEQVMPSKVTAASA